MTAGRRYLVLAAGLTGLAAAIIALLALTLRAAGWLALGCAAVTQVALGWWLVESVGRPRFFGAWVAGMLARLALVGVVGLVVVPAGGWDPEPVLVALVALMMMFVLLEGAVLMIQRSRVEIR